MIVTCPHCQEPVDTKQIAAERLERFADFIADGLTITEAAKAVGVSQQRGSEMMKQLERGLAQ